jgi:tetratricopeptide (TPR) repeat protein
MKPKRSVPATTMPPAPDERRLWTAAARDPRAWCGALVIIAAVLAAHWNGLANGFNYDDLSTVIENPHYRGLGPAQLGWMFTTFRMGHYQPLSWVTLGADYLLWGDRPFGYHLTNLILHVANALLVFWLALAVLGARGADQQATPRRPGWAVHLAAIVAALLFALHPLRVESVAWVTERRDVLSSFFLLLTLLLYLHAHGGASVQRPRAWLAAALGVFLLSLLSRAVGITLPVVLLVLDWYPLRRLGPATGGWFTAAARRVYVEKIPFLVPALVFAVIAGLAQTYAEAAVPLTEHGVWARLLQACYGVVFYLWKTVAPFGLSPLYQMPAEISLRSVKYLLAPIALLLIVLVLARYGRRWPWLTVVALLHAVLLSPVLGLAQSGLQEVADRYSYLPSIGWALLVGGGLLWLWRRPRWRGLALAGTGVSVAGLAGLAVLTARQSLVWRTPESLWEQAIRAAPGPITHHNLAAIYARRGRLNDAIEQYHAALRIEPLDRTAAYGLAKALTDARRLDEAVPAWQRILRFAPDDTRARLQFALVQRDRHDLAQALAEYREVARRQPDATEAYVRMAEILLAQQRLEEAREACHRALALEPEQPEAHYMLGLLHGQRGEHEAALARYRRALQARPDFVEAGVNLGVTLEWLGQRDAAIAAYRAVLEHHPDHTMARYNLAVSLSRAGQRDAALAEVRAVLQREPEHPDARRLLAALEAPPADGK